MPRDDLGQSSDGFGVPLPTFQHMVATDCDRSAGGNVLNVDCAHRLCAGLSRDNGEKIGRANNRRLGQHKPHGGRSDLLDDSRDRLDRKLRPQHLHGDHVRSTSQNCCQQ